MSTQRRGQQIPTKTNTFSFAGLELRCVTIDGQPWFVAADVCRMIGFDVGTGKSTSRYLSTLDASEKRTVSEVSTLGFEI